MVSVVPGGKRRPPLYSLEDMHGLLAYLLLSSQDVRVRRYLGSSQNVQSCQKPRIKLIGISSPLTSLASTILLFEPSSFDRALSPA